MLAPDVRAVLIDQLRPPPGYRLDYAVATTFTLDLAAALVPPLAFAQFRAGSTTDDIAMMEAVQSSADRFDIFCQAGKMNVPRRVSDLVAFLEHVVHEVRHPRPGRLFHPKLWLLRYSGGDDWNDTYRLLCLTRNLTLDRSHDIILRLDGERVGRRLAANRPLAELIRTLPNLTVKPLPHQRESRLEELAGQIRRVEWDRPDHVNEVLFHVLGLPGFRARPDFSGYRHLVVSPFCTNGGLGYVAPDSPDVTVVSRSMELDRLSSETVQAVTTYVVNPLARLDEPGTDSEDASDQPPPTELHAKLYVAERARRAHVFIGSANATDAAFGGNVEFLVELVGGATKLGVDTYLGSKAPFATLLEPYEATGGPPSDPGDEERWKLEQALAAVAEVGYEATVTSDGIDYAVTVTSEKPLTYPPAFELRMELLTRPGQSFPQTPETAAKATFTGVPLADVTPFVVLRMSSPSGFSARTVVRAELFGDPAGRLDAIVARQLDTTEKFLQFVALLLGLGAAPELSAGVAERAGTRSTARLIPGTGLFELLVRALADRPEVLADLDSTVRRLRASGDGGRRVLPEGFDELWQAVLAARDELEATTGD